MPYSFLADVVLAVHAAVAVFVVGGLVLIMAGNWLRWRWVNGWAFRLAHMAAIAIIVAQAWLGELCPLTTLESWLRVEAGGTPYPASFIGYWLQRFLFYDAPFWLFTLVYTIFAALVLAAWWYYPPERRRGHGKRG